MSILTFLNPQFLRFLLAGGVAVCANYGSRFLFSLWTSYEVAIVLAYLVGMAVAFILMRGHVFGAAEKALLPQVTRFIAVNILAVLQTLVISILLARRVLPDLGIIEQAEALAHLAGVSVPVVSSYFGHRYLTFK
jgi:putative flippase GtrA